mmetsp:Transcript_42187/g.73365  ORF Transcript_42187/g.73365 Transcript_42187/m.73365 type:complete len:232 (+) Transcript_42187:333-1028(+)
MRQLVHHEDKISRNVTHRLIGHLVELDSVAVTHAHLDVHSQLNLFFLGHAIGARRTRGLPGLATRHARSICHLDLLHESGCKLLHSDLDTGALAIFVVLLTSICFWANDLAQVRYIQNFSKIQLAQSNTDGNFNIGRTSFFLLPSLTSKAEVFEYTEWVVSRCVFSLFLLLYSFLSTSIVGFSLILVGENIVSYRQLSKFLRSVRRGVLIRVILQAKLPVSLFNLSSSCSL